MRKKNGEKVEEKEKGKDREKEREKERSKYGLALKSYGRIHIRRIQGRGKCIGITRTICSVIQKLNRIKEVSSATENTDGRYRYLSKRY